MKQKNKYVDFISDAHLLNCIEILYSSYSKAKKQVTKQSFYSNKIDAFKLTFDSKFNNLEDEKLIQSEILRQIDKSINNSIGTFHEQILSGIQGYERGNLDGYDIKAIDETLFADIKNKYNTMNSSSAESLFQKLSKYADEHKKAKCYWVQILAKSSFNELWKGDINGKEYSHSRVYKISGDRFYALLAKQDDALYQLYKKLPIAIDDFLKNQKNQKNINTDSILDEIKKDISTSNRSILEQITFENFSYYLGFNDLE
jgi:hypothetical protein